MSACTFFGHRECSGLEMKQLSTAIEDLISQGVDTFYVGNQGQFDAMVRSALQKLQVGYPHMCYGVVLAYLPGENRSGEDYADTIYPEGMELGPARFAIERRNRWMLDRAEYLICYVNHCWGGAYKFFCLAKKQGKKIINLYDLIVESGRK